MRLTKARQKQLDETYDTLIQVCLYDRPLKDMEPFLADDVMNFGAGRKELTKTKTAFLRQIKHQKKLAAGLKMDFQIKPVLRKTINNGDGAIYTDDIVNTVWVNGDKNKLKFRLSFIFEYKDRKWILVHSHTSTPDSQRNDDEVWPVEELKKRTAVLEKSLEEKITELQVKNRELEIEAALEKVRARTMGMRDSEELPEVASLLFKQIADLGTKSWSSGFMIGEPEGNTINSRMSRPDGSIGIPFNIPLTEDSFFINIYEARQRGENFFVMESGGKELEETYRYMFSLPEAAKAMGSIENLGFQMPTFQITHCVFFSHGFLMFITYEPCPEMWDIFKRFGKSFEQTYTRFLDLKRAEVQARAAQIEAALERVRSRSMGMQKSEELREVIQVIYEQLLHLNFTISNAGFLMDYRKNDDGNIWMTDALTEIPTQQYIPYFDHVFNTEYLEQKEKGPELFTRIYSIEEKNSWLENIFKYMPSLPGEVKKIMLSSPALALSRVLLKDIGLYLFNYNGTLYTAEENATLIRFGKVFEQTYTRFLDLKRAEEQAREAQIEAGLERVRSRAMAMQTSEELNELIGTVFTELTKLDLVLTRCVILIYEGAEKGVRWWMANSEAPAMPMNFFVKYADMPFFNEYLNGWHERALKWQYVLEGENKIKTDEFLFHETELSSLPDFVIAGMSAPGRVYLNASFNNFGNLTLASLEPLSNEHFDILLRFAKVFDLTYTRFSDLKQAEAQTREAQIELGLERVRAKTMAMHKSEEVIGVASCLNDELKKLGFEGGATIIIMNGKNGDMDHWTGFAQNNYSKSCYVPYFKHPCHDAQLDAWKKDEKFLEYILAGEEKRSFDEFFFTQSGYKDFPEEDKKWMRALKSVVFSFAFMKYGAIHSGPASLSEEQARVLQRFSKVFEQSYTRFLDLQKAEAQAREALIEAALERVRARAMAMHQSGELQEVAIELRKQLGLLGQKELETCAIHLYDESPDYFQSWAALLSPNAKGEVIQTSFQFPKRGTGIIEELMECYAMDKHDYVLVNEGARAQEFLEMLKQYAPEAFEVVTSGLKNLAPGGDRAYWSVADFTGGALVMTTMVEPGESSRTLLRRFSNVFDLAYRRFVDLKNAEAQAKEAKIEVALEKLRSRTMGMQKSDELKEVIRVVCDQFIQLNILVEHAGFIIDYKERDDMLIWLADQHQVPFQVTIPYFDCQHWNSFVEAKKKGTNFFANLLDFEEKNRFYEDLFKLFPVPDEAKNFYLSCPCLAISTILLENVGLYIENFQGIPYTDEENTTLMRFGKVFQQTYTRFLDLQKAEAQARESQIQLAMERARAQSMMMQYSSELDDTLRVFHEQVLQLGIPSAFSFLWLPDEETDQHIFWAAWAENNLTAFKSKAIKYPLDRNDPATVQCMIDWKSNQPVVSYYVPPTQVENYFAAWEELFGGAQELKPEYFSAGLHYVEAFLKYGCFGVMVKSELHEDEKNILARFATEFERTYTRFLDLQKAEAQGREAKIEAALERIRSRSLAMHHSNEIGSVVAILFEKLKELGLIFDGGAGIHFFTKGSKDAVICVISPELSAPIFNDLPYDEEAFVNNPIILDVWQAKDTGEHIINKTYSFEQKNRYFKDYLFKYNDDLAKLPQAVRDFILNAKSYTATFISEKNSLLGASSWTEEMFSDSDIEVLKRVARVFEQAYIRFLDLQKAEAQAREAQIETALERVRSRTLAMQKSGELAETATVLFKQLMLLGVEPNRLYINIIQDDHGHAESWITDEDGSKVITAFITDLNANPTFKKMVDGWKAQKKSLIIDVHGKELEEYFDHLNSIGVRVNRVSISRSAVAQAGLSQKRRLHYLAYFSKGFIGMASPEEQPKETLQLLERFAAVFNLTFTRFNDLKVAEAHALQAEQDLVAIKAAKKNAEDALVELQFTQKQLIQSEKMASLGELTAGIAHEIQNPLNFVNNFSDVSNELLEEMKEQLATGNVQQAIGLANDVRQNLEKINHHGKRADAIVKGMLQHSRSSSGQKEPTDINVLCDEYLRLAYHGLRAKDKTFNARFEIDFDNAIGKIDLIPQEVGRAILNMINNAFYAVKEKKKQFVEGYEPMVVISSKKSSDDIEIRIKDNGIGIPPKALDKIFQPFFTTKPTGQGTGLGLSLAYDIITNGHGGELAFVTEEGEGTEFIIRLPYKG
jgi:signal transduction histidine kinase/short-subunit dehydrogenase involved in D-alanine esterification of teichoic acids